jgi:hypothetical protein
LLFLRNICEKGRSPHHRTSDLARIPRPPPAHHTTTGGAIPIESVINRAPEFSNPTTLVGHLINASEWQVIFSGHGSVIDQKHNLSQWGGKRKTDSYKRKQVPNGLAQRIEPS